MAIAFDCQRCGKHFTVGDALAGRPCRCKRCGHEFAIPQGTGGSPPAIPERDDPPVSAPAARETLLFDCDRCGKRFEGVDAAMTGQIGRCKQCGHVFTIRGDGPRRRRPAASPRHRERDDPPVPASPPEPAPREVPPAVASVAPVVSSWADETPVLPQRAPAGKRPRTRKRPANRATAAQLPAWTFLVGGGVGLLAAWADQHYLPRVMSPISSGFCVLGCLMIGMGLVGGMVLFARESLVLGRLCLSGSTLKISLVLLLGGGACMTFPRELDTRFPALRTSIAWPELGGPLVTSGSDPAGPAPVDLSIDGKALEQAIIDLIAFSNEVTDIVDSMVDRQSALRARMKIMESMGRHSLIFQPKVRPITAAEEHWLEQKYTEPLRTALTRLNDSIERVQRLSGQPVTPLPLPRYADGTIDVSAVFRTAQLPGRRR